MHYTFIRKGYANNSSSSHSIIFAPDTELYDEYDGADFGWSFFTCSSEKAKNLYLLATIKSNFGYDEELDFSNWVLKNFQDTFFDIDNLLKEVNFGYGVDHQSVIMLPKDYNNPAYPSVQFIKELINELRNSEYVILGGNDNSDDPHSFTKYHQSTPKSDNLIDFINTLVDSTSTLIVVKDINTLEWIVSNSDEGDIIKFLFNKDLKKYSVDSIDELLDDEDKINEIQKSSFPYLVDLNITNYCVFDCEFCYQSSTHSGAHSNTNFIINKILPELKRANVFEIVLGGGEPTLHPDIEQIVNSIKKQNFKLSITTKNYNFVKKLKNPAKFLNNIDSIALSCNTISELHKVKDTINLIKEIKDSYRPSIYIQTIIGTQSLSDFRKFIDECSVMRINNITLLGWKEFGFGNNVKPYILGNKWIEIIKMIADKNWIKFGIDSVLVKAFRSELLHNNIKWQCLVAAEGKQTCYINAVDKYVAPSSFTNNNNISYNFDTGDFNNIFLKF